METTVVDRLLSLYFDPTTSDLWKANAISILNLCSRYAKSLFQAYDFGCIYTLPIDKHSIELAALLHKEWPLFDGRKFIEAASLNFKAPKGSCHHAPSHSEPSCQESGSASTYKRPYLAILLSVLAADPLFVHVNRILFIHAFLHHGPWDSIHLFTQVLAAWISNGYERTIEQGLFEFLDKDCFSLVKGLEVICQVSSQLILEPTKWLPKLFDRFSLTNSLFERKLIVQIIAQKFSFVQVSQMNISLQKLDSTILLLLVYHAFEINVTLECIQLLRALLNLQPGSRELITNFSCDYSILSVATLLFILPQSIYPSCLLHEIVEHSPDWCLSDARVQTNLCLIISQLAESSDKTNLLEALAHRNVNVTKSSEFWKGIATLTPSDLALFRTKYNQPFHDEIQSTVFKVMDCSKEQELAKSISIPILYSLPIEELEALHSYRHIWSHNVFADAYLKAQAKYIENVWIGLVKDHLDCALTNHGSIIGSHQCIADCYCD